MRGKTTNLTVEVYRKLRAEGLSRGEIAARLGLTDTAVSKFRARHRAELQGTNTKVRGKKPNADMNPDIMDKLLGLNLHLTNQIEKIVKRLGKASDKEITKLTEVLIKCLGESRQQVIALQGVQNILDNRKTIFNFWKTVANAIIDETEETVKMKIFNRCLKSANPYFRTSEIQEAIEGVEMPTEVTGNE